MISRFSFRFFFLSFLFCLLSLLSFFLSKIVRNTCSHVVLFVGTEFILSCKADSEPSVTTTTEATPTESTRIHSGLEDPEVSGN